MESIYAALLLHKAGGKINETNVEKVLTAAGAKVDKDQIVKLIAGLKERRRKKKKNPKKRNQLVLEVSSKCGSQYNIAQNRTRI